MLKASRKGVFFNKKCVFLRDYGGSPSFFYKKCKVSIAKTKYFL